MSKPILHWNVCSDKAALNGEIRRAEKRSSQQSALQLSIRNISCDIFCCRLSSLHNCRSTVWQVYTPPFVKIDPKFQKNVVNNFYFWRLIRNRRNSLSLMTCWKDWVKDVQEPLSTISFEKNVKRCKLSVVGLCCCTRALINLTYKEDAQDIGIRLTVSATLNI